MTSKSRLCRPGHSQLCRFHLLLLEPRLVTKNNYYFCISRNLTPLQYRHSIRCSWLVFSSLSRLSTTLALRVLDMNS
ncbi:uncharacterized protein LACBIDRAFT_316782 [Laccaria bicolor S238N-H82]|uniref:Predicted protein n=1 Tax=Laccaria bicolor (strain S238N-H82 / ATCC MYA-4686) TaxID=486041 RepID=B0E1L7_LACBS|nr:uncharacterized protein LACBIDRAFT_316782 [Laccaria bicolor S238N-H82]EDQ99261.1 predicted protein [Laccaria bicolor S238N-H82]|eukprot:XP_001890071.1 predicted protein [Laccaria bicolor S238N-H82]